MSSNLVTREVPWGTRGDGLVLAVRLTPRSALDQIGGVEHDGRPVLKVKVRAVPQDGEANAALIRLLAKALHISTSAVRLESGAGGRLKILHLQGGPETLAASLVRLSSAGGDF